MAALTALLQKRRFVRREQRCVLHHHHRVGSSNFGDGASATDARINYPNSTAVDASGNIYIADSCNHCIRMVDAGTGDITTVAGNGTGGYSGDGSSATSAQLYYPNGLAVDGSGNIYIADLGNNCIRMVDSGTGNINLLQVSAARRAYGYSATEA
jgi:sugar lactone lactonase YvrE